ncbi:MAG: flagellar motor switch protein FliM [Dehalococcoidia bacterium]
MAEASILSQQEIDDLLSGSPSEAAEALRTARPRSKIAGLTKAVKRYDFRRPDKFSKEQLRTLQAVHETFGRLAASSLSNQLRTNVEIKVSSIDQGLYEEYVEQIADASFINVVRMAPLEGSVVVEYGQDFGMLVVDRVLGGAGAPLERSHEITDIELQLLRGVGGALAANVGEAWENLASVQPTITDVFQDIQLAQLAPPTEVVIMVFLEVTVLNLVAGLSICTPFGVLEPILPRLNAQVWVGTGGRRNVTADSKQNLRSQIERTPTWVSARLGSTDVRAADLARLQVGDVIRLDGLRSRPVPVSVGGIRKWYGRPGVVAGRVAVQLERVAPEESPAPAPVDRLETPAAASLENAPAELVTPTLDESEDARAA